jgi:hypothetical protein
MNLKNSLGRLRTGWRGWLLLLCLLVLLWKVLKIYKYLTRAIIINEVYTLCVNQGFGAEMSKILSCQAAHETGNFTSFLFFMNNNLFGMKQPQNRKTTSESEKNGYANYKDIEDAVVDIKYYFEYVGLSKNYFDVGSYVAALKRKGYYEDTEENYQKGIEYFYNKYYATE